ncbi:SH3 domain-containing protein [Microlunatus speluncae]|uniref:SH3 domain-containing protein n=1 Tax=Microlunatus speluncae TaxID=2594267 RepID=UPI0012662258|nr:SH3 domain-containing protein [Microlunatus speluncae]
MRVAPGIRRLAALTAAAGIAITAFATAVPAEAATTYRGKVIANGGLAVRSAPTTHAGSTGTIAEGRTITIECKVPSTRVDGNRLWYALSGNKGWVSARYVDNLGAAPKRCPEFDTEFGIGRADTALNLRHGPSTKDRLYGVAGKGAKLTVVCHESSQSVYGSRTWYLLNNGYWVHGAHVTRLPAVPSNWSECTE